MVEPADGGDELCSAAPPEVSGLPAGGIVAALDASGDTVPAVGGVDDDEVSAARAGANPVASAAIVIATRRFIVLLLSLLIIADNALVAQTFVSFEK
jgi:hypothetical protein